MTPPKLGLGTGLGVGVLLPAGYLSALAWAAQSNVSDVPLWQVEQALDRWFDRLGLPAQHHYVHTSAGRVHVLKVPGGPRPLVLVHGLAASAGEYGHLIRELRPEYTVYALDRPGAGLSDPMSFPGHPRTAWRRVIGQVAEAMGLDRFDLLGHSLGGFAAAAYAIGEPARVEHLFLLSPVGVASRLPPLWNFSLLPGIMVILGGLLRKALARDDPVARLVGAQSGWGLTWAPQELADYRRLIGLRQGRGGDLEAIPRLLRPFHFAPESLLLPALGLLAGRVLVVWGEKDTDVPLAPARDQLRHYPGIPLMVVPGQGHLMPFWAAREPVARIREWLAEPSV